MRKYFTLNGTQYLYDVVGGQYRIRWCYAGDRYSKPWERGKCKRTEQFRDKTITAYIKKNTWKRDKNGVIL